MSSITRLHVLFVTALLLATPLISDIAIGAEGEAGAVDAPSNPGATAKDAEKAGMPAVNDQTAPPATAPNGDQNAQPADNENHGADPEPLPPEHIPD